MKRPIIISALLLVAATVVSAQSIDSYEIRAYVQGSTTLATSTKATVTASMCNLTAITPPSTPPPNATYVYWNDPLNLGKMCRVSLVNLMSPITIKPGTYDLRLVAYIAGQASAESAVGEYIKAGPPPAPTGVFTAN